jgi:ATP-dependent RNA helicase DDX5/DBP2
MASSASAPASKGPRYAPPDPTLPQPWRALIDGNTGYIYFWNPETKVTQYERPVGAVPAASPSQPPGYSRPEERPRSSGPSEVTINTPIPRCSSCFLGMRLRTRVGLR